MQGISVVVVETGGNLVAEGYMTNRERTMAVLNYKEYDRMPIVHFGFWRETLAKWAAEGHITEDEARLQVDGNDYSRSIAQKLGFDFVWTPTAGANTHPMPWFTEKTIEEMPDGSKKVLSHEGVVILVKPGTVSIPAEIDHTLKDRASWEEHYLPRLQFTPDRVPQCEHPPHDTVRMIFCGSLYGEIRNWLGVEGSAYMYVDDEVLFTEMIDTMGELCYKCVEAVLNQGLTFDVGHFWEDICFKSGPLINPQVFREKVGPHYKRITDLLASHGTEIVTLDCDGKIDDLVGVWFDNGVNTMFPIEVGTWDANIRPWREKYGSKLRGVGGMNKVVFSRDYQAVDEEIERLKPLVALGGFIPCPDHRIPPDAIWDNVKYYCEKAREAF